MFTLNYDWLNGSCSIEFRSHPSSDLVFLNNSHSCKCSRLSSRFSHSSYITFTASWRELHLVSHCLFHSRKYTLSPRCPQKDRFCFGRNDASSSIRIVMAFHFFFVLSKYCCWSSASIIVERWNLTINCSSIPSCKFVNSTFSKWRNPFPW